PLGAALEGEGGGRAIHHPDRGAPAGHEHDQEQNDQHDERRAAPLVPSSTFGGVHVDGDYTGGPKLIHGPAASVPRPCSTMRTWTPRGTHSGMRAAASSRVAGPGGPSSFPP